MPILSAFAAAALLMGAPLLRAQSATLGGRVTDPQGKPVAAALVSLRRGAGAGPLETRTGSDGRYAFEALPAGAYQAVATAPGFVDAVRTLAVAPGVVLTLDLQFQRLAARAETVTVAADVNDLDLRSPDPAQRTLVREESLDANPGRPGAPISIPGLPIETASGGIKAPQYFAPGVAGDHGEPIATFLQVGSFLVPDNLSANAHGNGYADPNIMVPAIVESVQTDGGAFNVREGDHSVDLAAVYALRQFFEPFVTLTADARDADLAAGWKWVAIQASYGDGFVDLPEHRRQYKLNALRGWAKGAHRLTALFLGYYGQSRLPGLAPIDVPGLHDTIDPRQRDQTHTGEAALNDVWRLSPAADLELSAFFRTYNLSLLSDFGDGLIRQSEFRTVTGANAVYVRKLNRRVSFMAGFDYLRDAPRRDNLDRYLSASPSVYGPFEKVASNDITLDFATPFAALDGDLVPWLRFNLAWRRDQIGFDNTDLLHSGNSFERWLGVDSPKATLSFAPPESLRLPPVALSFGQAFFTNDPRTGTGTEPGSLVSRAHAYQLVARKTVGEIDFRVTLGHVTQEASLAKIDPDTGLQLNQGPSRNRYVTASARRSFHDGLLQASVSKADARDLAGGGPLPEAPRLILDALGALDRLPFHLRAQAEFQEVGSKPLGDGFVSVPVREFRGALSRSFLAGRLQAGLHFEVASGYTGQTTEVLALPTDSQPFERVVGVYLPSYATASVSYRFGPPGRR